MHRIELLEQIKNKELPEVRKRFSYYELKAKKIHKKISYFSNMFDDHLIFHYFNKFENRWSAFINATLIEKLIFVSFMSFGFIICFAIEPFVLIILPVPIIISLALFMFFNLCFQFFQAIVPSKGNLRSAIIHFDEMLKSLKIGGRDAEVLPESSNSAYLIYGGSFSGGGGGGGWGGFGGGSSGGGGAGGSW